ncbi:MAG: flavodoxin domain-containing protein [Sulfuricaulis sp.]|nr:flavodoxin domain-containing protein [Sulfuricaulis sp.]
MPRTLILYATTEGHTAWIVERIAQRLRGQGHTAETHRADNLPTGLNPAAFDGVIVGSSIHYGHHPRYLCALVRRYREVLALRPSAFFSVSLSAGGPGAKPEAAQRYLDTFLRQVNWQPAQTTSFAGALQYSKYGRFKRWLMRMIVGIAGGDIDPTRDYEYTDWDAVERFADTFAQRLKQA